MQKQKFLEDLEVQKRNGFAKKAKSKKYDDDFLEVSSRKFKRSSRRAKLVDQILEGGHVEGPDGPYVPWKDEVQKKDTGCTHRCFILVLLFTVISSSVVILVLGLN